MLSELRTGPAWLGRAYGATPQAAARMSDEADNPHADLPWMFWEFWRVGKGRYLWVLEREDGRGGCTIA